MKKKTQIPHRGLPPPYSFSPFTPCCFTCLLLVPRGMESLPPRPAPALHALCKLSLDPWAPIPQAPCRLPSAWLASHVPCELLFLSQPPAYQSLCRRGFLDLRVPARSRSQFLLLSVTAPASTAATVVCEVICGTCRASPVQKLREGRDWLYLLARAWYVVVLSLLND